MTTRGLIARLLAVLLLVASFVALDAWYEGSASVPSAFDSGRVSATANSSGYTPIVALPFTPSAVTVEAQSPQAGQPNLPFGHVTALVGNGFQTRWTTQTGAVFVGPLVYSYIATAGPAPPPPTSSPPTTTAATSTAPPPPCAPITITAGGTYSGCYQSSATGTPAVTVATAQPVTLDHASVAAKGYGLVDSVAGVQLTVVDTVFTQQDPRAVVDHRAIALTKGVAAVDVEHNSFTDGDGIWVAAPTSSTFTVSGGVKADYNLSTNIGRYPNPKDFGCCVQFLQLTQVTAPGAEIAWNHTANTQGQSGVEDNINFWNSGGTSTAKADIHHNLIDGAYPVTPDAQFTGGGINVGDANDHNANVHDNTVVSTTNYGVSGVSAAGVFDTHIYNNLLVNDGAEQASAFGQAQEMWNPSGSISSTCTATGNSYNWHRSTTDATQYPCYQSANCSGSVLVSTTEQQARDAWEAARVAAGVVVGPR